MAVFVLPVVAGRSHRGTDVKVGIGTFSSAEEAEQWGMRLKLAEKIIGFDPAVEMMSLKQYDAWLAARAAENKIPLLPSQTDNV